ncbi:hypothetical protein [Planococcus beigongshangi]|uniref:hypothetical protein n=1 Tax=Planococcus beigongshangi TaxID=2782536 RepID=UPI00193C1302|nr:hypothetical protein [Planococcus beigongshangi]
MINKIDEYEMLKAGAWCTGFLWWMKGKGDLWFLVLIGSLFCLIVFKAEQA